MPGVGRMPAHIFPGMSNSLISVSALVDLKLTVTFDCDKVSVLKGRDVILQGDRNPLTGLWYLNLSQLQVEPSTLASPVMHTAAPAIQLSTADDTIDFWHKTFGSQPASTFLNAVEKGWIVIPGVTGALVRRHMPQSIATSLGHLDQTQQGLRSTQEIEVAESLMATQSDIHSNVPTETPLIFSRVYECTGRMHSDAAGRFPIQSVSGKLYMIIYYSEDGNYIHIELTRSRKAPDLLLAFQNAVQFFSSRGRTPHFARMDNECAAATKTWAVLANIDIELVPPGQHRTNRAERAIRTWKAHFIAILAGIDPDCPMYLWEYFIEQAELTLNLSRPCATYPTISAWEGLCGKFNLNATPIAPLGIKVVVHNKPDERLSWDTHGEVAFYVGRATQHYRCWSVWVLRTRMLRISDTVAWHPVRMRVPGSAPTTELTAAVQHMSATLQTILDRPTLTYIHPHARKATNKLLQQYVDLESIEALFRQPPPPQDLTAITAASDPSTSTTTWPRGCALPLVAPSLPTPPTPLHNGQQRVHIPLATISPTIVSSPTPQQRVQAQPTLHTPTPAPPAPSLPISAVQMIQTPPSVIIAAPVIARPARATRPTMHTRSQQRVPIPVLTTQPPTSVTSGVDPHTQTSHSQPLSQPSFTVGPSNVICLPPRVRSQQSAFITMSPVEIKQINHRTLKCIGKQFVDDSNPSDVHTGIVDDIVRHKTSRKLSFKYWDHVIHSKKPTRNKDFLYHDVTYAMKTFTWSKLTNSALSAAATLHVEQMLMNLGPSKSQQRNARRRQGNREPAPWYHKLIYLCANSATISCPQHYVDFHACTAQDMNADGTPLTSASALRGPEKHKWMIAHGEEIVRLVESLTGKFIHRQDMPHDRKAAYYNPQVKIKMKPEGPQYRVRGTIGGDQIHYPGTTAAYTAALETIRILLNTVVSEDANFFTADIKDFYLGTPLERPEFMRISLKHIPIDIQERYNIAPMVHNGYVIMEINKGIYGLPQAGKLAQDRLVSHLTLHGYHQCTNTPCLFVHTDNGVAFSLVVDDFLVKYKDRSAANHLLAALRELYIVTDDFAATQKYVGITLKHNKAKRTIHMSMPGYVQKALRRFNRLNLKGANSPITYVAPVYGAFHQEVRPEPPSPPLTAAETLELQEIVGVFLFYARAVDPLMITAINKIGLRQSKPTRLIQAEIERFFQYASRFPDSTLCIRASNMKLTCHSDASYLSEANARSRAGGYLFLGDCLPGEIPNAAISYFSVLITTVVTSAAEAEYAALFMVGQAAVSIRNTLADLGYPQGATELICDNKCAVGIAKNTLKLKRSKTIDMRYHWIRDQVHLKNFLVTWQAGASNLADFFTKAHPVHHHLSQRSFYVVDNIDHLSRSEGVLV